MSETKQVGFWGHEYSLVAHNCCEFLNRTSLGGGEGWTNQMADRIMIVGLHFSLPEGTLDFFLGYVIQLP